MTQRDWERDDAHCSACSSTARRSRDRDAHGEPIVDDSFLLLFNAHHEDVTFTLPTRRFGASWRIELDTAEPDGRAGRAAARDARGAVDRAAAVDAAAAPRRA